MASTWVTTRDKLLEKRVIGQCRLYDYSTTLLSFYTAKTRTVS